MVPLHRIPRLSFRTIRVGLRILAIAFVLFGPIAAAAWAVHAPERLAFGYAELRAETAPATTAETLRRYHASRNPVVDKLLPNGAGGTRVFADLDGNAGMAFPNVPAVGLAVSALESGWPEAVELHERAHLLQAFLPGRVTRLLSALPPPVSGEYAATNSKEHFAEMASMAWQIVTPPDLMCVEELPIERLPDVEARVPGTAGFVVRYLRHLPPGDVEQYDELLRLASNLAASYTKVFEAVWEAMDQRRLPHGDFRPWERPTIRGHVQRWRDELSASDGWFDRLGSYVLVPSLGVLQVWDAIPV
jgi:hypothetical protein